MTHRACAIVCASALAACFLNPQASEPTPATGSGESANASAPPYQYPPEYRQPWMDGCQAEGHDEATCSCVYEKAQWHIPPEQIESQQVDEATAKRLFAECMVGL